MYFAYCKASVHSLLKHMRNVAIFLQCSKPIIGSVFGRVVHGTYLSVPFPSHPIAIYACPIPSHGMFPMGFPQE